MQIKPSTVAVLLVYAAPILFYGLMFGPTIATEHVRWAEFGSAMAGIYAPIVALTTLVILVRQTKLQSQINGHQYDQAHLVQARADLDFYASKLAESLEDRVRPNTTVRQYLRHHFRTLRIEDLDKEELREVAEKLNSSSPQMFDLWSAVYPIFGSLEAQRTDPHFTFKATLTSSKTRLIALLSFETCVCLENFYRVRTDGQIDVPYQFSPLLKNSQSEKFLKSVSSSA
jgi:hypothetical protein